jgi:hypothetical protein
MNTTEAFLRQHPSIDLKKAHRLRDEPIRCRHCGGEGGSHEANCPTGPSPSDRDVEVGSEDPLHTRRDRGWVKDLNLEPRGYTDEPETYAWESETRRRIDRLFEAPWVSGSDLSPEEREHVKRAYVHRFTGQHKPDWVSRPRPNGKPYPLHFKDDDDWLRNTKFDVTKGGRLSRRTKHSQSNPTFPNGIE